MKAKQPKILRLRNPSKFPAFTSLKPSDMSIEKFEKGIAGLLKEQKLTAEKLVYARQVHGARVLAAKSPAFRNLREADGFVTNKTGYLLSIFTADCLPVVLFDAKKNCIGAVHCGWKSTYKAIVKNAVKRMKRLYGSKPKDIQVRFGPSIHKCCYEVSPELAAKFAKRFGNSCVLQKGQKVFLDLEKANETLLVRCAIPRKNIQKNPHCTRCRKDLFYSYRRDGKGTGRMVTSIIINKSLKS